MDLVIVEKERPTPDQGVGKSGRSRRTWNAEIARYGDEVFLIGHKLFF